MGEFEFTTREALIERAKTDVPEGTHWCRVSATLLARLMVRKPHRTIDLGIDPFPYTREDIPFTGEEVLTCYSIARKEAKEKLKGMRDVVLKSVLKEGKEQEK